MSAHHRLEPGDPAPPLLGTHTPARAVIIISVIMLGLAGLLVVFVVVIQQKIAEVGAMSASADAVVVGVRSVRTGEGTTRFPIYRWSHEGQTYVHESRSSDSDASEGDRTRVRFDPDAPELVDEDSGSGLWGDMIPLGIGAVVVFGLFLLFGLGLLKSVRTLRRANAASAPSRSR